MNASDIKTTSDAAKQHSRDKEQFFQRDAYVFKKPDIENDFLCTIFKTPHTSWPSSWQNKNNIELIFTALHRDSFSGRRSKRPRSLTQIRSSQNSIPVGPNLVSIGSFNLKLNKEQWLKIGQVQGWDKDKDLIIDMSKESGATGQTIGTVVGTIAGSWIPIPILGSMLGGVAGGLIGDWIGGADEDPAASDQGDPDMPEQGETDDKSEALKELATKMTEKLEVVDYMFNTVSQVAVSINAPCKGEIQGQCNITLNSVEQLESTIENLQRRVSDLASNQNNAAVTEYSTSKNPQEICSLLQEVLAIRACIQTVTDTIEPGLQYLNAPSGVDIGTIG